MNYFNVGKIVQYPRLTREMRVLSVTDFGRAFKKGRLALFSEKDQFVQTSDHCQSP